MDKRLSMTNDINTIAGVYDYNSDVKTSAKMLNSN